MSNFIYYAVLSNYWVVTVVEMTEIVDHPDYVLLPSNDTSVIGCWYNVETQEFLTEAEYNLMLMATVDGEESGLDADTLDGQHAASFASATHNHDEAYAPIDHTHAAITASDILTKLKTVDGTDSGLDADLLDGYNASHFAIATHNHDAAYASASHNHDTVYADADHEHTDYATTAQLSGKADAVHNHDEDYADIDHSHSNYAESSHTHSEYATTAQLANKADASHTHTNYATTAQLAGKSDTGHTHSNYATLDDLDTKADSDHTHSAYAPTSHTHSNYATTAQLANKADSNHTHSAYAASSHTHSNYSTTTHTHSNYAATSHTHDYLSTAGGTLSGDLVVNGVIKTNGQQAFYYATSSASQTVGTNNATGGTTIACGSSATVNVNGSLVKTASIVPRTNNSFQLGNSTYRWKGIYSTAAVNVSSDRRLKTDIEALDSAECADFISNLPIVKYRYNADAPDIERIGVIAQDVLEAGDIGECFVNLDDNGYYGVYTSDLVFPLIATVKGLMARVEELEKALKAKE